MLGIIKLECQILKISLNEQGHSVARPKSIHNIIHDFFERYIVGYIVNLGFLCDDIVIEFFSDM